MRTLKLGGESIAEISTRLPYKLHLYSRALAMSRGMTVRGLYTDAARQFLKAEPWRHGFKFRQTQAPVKSNRTRSSSDSALVGAKMPTDWLQVNMRLPLDTAQALESVSKETGASMSSVAYSVVFWYCWFVYPPASESARRAKKG